MIEMPVPTDSTLSTVARALGVTGSVTYSARPLDFEIAAPGTGGLWRVHIAGANGSATSVVKALRHPSGWPMLAQLSDSDRAMFLATFPWSGEPEVLTELTAVCPVGMRAVGLLGSQWHGDQLRTMWMEDLGEASAPFTAEQIAGTARLLGELAGRRSLAGSAMSEAFEDGFALTMIARGRVMSGLLPLLSGPMGDAAGDLVSPELVSDLLWVGEHLEDVLGVVHALPQTPVHGDAAPENLRQDPCDAGMIVLIDTAQFPRHAVGYDLGQLLFGRGSPAIAMGEGFIADVVGQFVRGLADGGLPTAAADVWTGFVGSALIRNGFDVVTPGDDVPDRIATTRYLIDKAAELGLLPHRELTD